MSGRECNKEYHRPGTEYSGPAQALFGMGEDDALSTSPLDTMHAERIEPMIHCQPPKSQRIRRRRDPGPDHVKHRRTRSGCYTCRSRRVKCDETHPICNRCRKGGRDCAYPDSPGPKDAEAAQRESPASSNEYDDDTSPDNRLPTIPDEDEGSASGSQRSINPRRRLRRINTGSSLSMNRFATQSREMSSTPPQEDYRSTSLALSESTTSDATPTGAWMLPEYMFGRKPDWRHLPPDFQVHLEYHVEHITHWKYGAHADFDDFFHTTFINLALQNEALLYALVGFAAFKRMLKDPNGQIQDFLHYYTHSVTLLLGLLQKQGEAKYDVATLLTILQLATLEEFLGDYVNLMAHQKAALEILMQLFTPHTILQTSLGRTILGWYVRFDLLGASVGFTKPGLPQHWIEANNAYCQARAAAEPDSREWLFDSAQAELGLISFDMCYLVGRRKAGELSEAEFRAEHATMTTRLRGWRDALHPALTDAANLVPVAALRTNNDDNNGGGGGGGSSSRSRSSSSSRSGSSSSRSSLSRKLFCYFPDGQVPLYAEPFCFTTAIICEWHSVVLMHLCQATGDAVAEVAAITELGDQQQHAVAVCEIIETAERWEMVPKGLLMMLHPSLGMASVFLPRSARHHMWLRKQFAWLESCGYVFPAGTRARMAHLFEDESVVRWWLPDNQGFTPVLQSVRAFADERSNGGCSVGSGDMKEVFDAFVDLQLQDSSKAATSP